MNHLDPPPFSSEFGDCRWAHIAGYNDVQWLAAPPDTIALLNTRPQSGQTYTLLSHSPFVSALQRDFWTIYRPALAELNGWVDFPDLFDESALVACERVDTSVEQQPHQMVVRVREVILLRDLVNRFVPTRVGSLDLASFQRYPSHVHTYRWNDFTYVDRNFQSEWGTWLICQRTELGYAMILFGGWDPEGRDQVYAGHRLLSQAEIEVFGLPPL